MANYPNFLPPSHDEAPVNPSKLFQDRLAESVEKLVRQQVESLVGQIPQNNRRENHQRLAGAEKLEFFDPEDVSCNVDRWILRYDDLGERYDWSDFEKMFLLKSKLRGRAREWYIKLDAQHLDLTWNDWKKELWKTFNNHQSSLSERDFGADLEELVARRKTPNESMAMYFYDKVALCEKCGIVEEKAVSCIIRGLPEKIRPQVYQFRCSTPEALLLEFIQLFDHLDREERKELRFSPPPENNYDGIAINETLTQPWHSKESEPVKIKKCYACKANGHLRRNCLQKLKKETRPVTVKQCFVCKMEDHVAKDCPQKQDAFQVTKVKLEPHTAFKQCFVCKMEDHVAKDCPQKQDAFQATKVKLEPHTTVKQCFVCKMEDHVAKDCPQKQDKFQATKVKLEPRPGTKRKSGTGNKTRWQRRKRELSRQQKRWAAPFGT